MALTTLPTEILITILQDDNLTRDDHEALRLTNRTFCAHLTPVIFQRICVSKTKKDWDAFCEIASRPHLAKCVKELVWYELLEYENILCQNTDMGDDEGTYSLCLSCACMAKEAQGDYGTVHELSCLASDIFWLTPKILRNREALAELQRTFLSALVCMPGLESFVSSPMPPRHILCDGPYLFTAQVFQAFFKDEGRVVYGDHTRQSINAINPGFCEFLALTMTWELSTIRRLHFVDSAVESGIINFRDPQSTVFEKLTHVNLCLNLDPYSGRMVLYLRGARNLQCLRICIDRTLPTTRATTTPLLQQAMTIFFGIEPARHWPNLTTLELVGFEVQADDGAFLSLLQTHALTLRYLTMQSCRVHRLILEGIATVPGLNLSSFRVIDYVDNDGVLVEEEDLLAFVNGEEPTGQVLANLEPFEVINTSSTHLSSAMRRAQIALASDAMENVGAIAGVDSDYPERETPNDHPSVYVLEKCEAGAARWEFAICDGQVCCWVSQDPGARQTQVWQFYTIVEPRPWVMSRLSISRTGIARASLGMSPWRCRPVMDPY